MPIQNIINLAVKYGNYRYAQGRSRALGAPDANEHARVADEVFRELEGALRSIPSNELAYANALADSIWHKYYRHEAPDWKPLPDLMGVIMQIDNMVTGLTRAAGAPLPKLGE